LTLAGLATLNGRVEQISDHRRRRRRHRSSRETAQSLAEN
jgi:hypothetical protein